MPETKKTAGKPRKKAKDFQPKARLPHVQIVVTRFGKPLYYYRRAGFPSTPLPQPETLEYTMDEDFMDAWRKLELQALRPASESEIVPGTFHALIRDYKASPEWQALSPRTRADYEQRALSIIGKKWGDKKVARIEVHHVVAFRDSYQSTPRTSKYIVQVLSVLFTWGKLRNYCTGNPAFRIPALKQGEGYKAWTEADVAAFLAASPDWRMRLAMLLALNTGQRLADLAALRWTAFDGAGFYLVQQKTTAPLYIPLTQEFKTELELMPRKTIRKVKGKKVYVPHQTVLVNSRGGTWTRSGLANAFRKACDAAGLQGLSMHGLRKLATSRLLDAGCSKEEVKAITGHKTDAMVDHYDKSGNQKRRSTAAVLKLEQKGKGESGA